MNHQEKTHLIGYACQNLDILDNKYKTVRVANFNDEIGKQLIAHNLKVLEDTIDYNIENDIKLFRISSSLIPFASNSKIMKFDWKNEFANTLERIRNKIVFNDIRISMHPGQYVILNSLNDKTIQSSIDELDYHADVIEVLGGCKKNKMIVHIGGVFNNKTESINRFIDVVNHRLSKKIKDHLVIENDDRLYNIEDVLYISSMTKLPVVFDNLHNEINKGPSHYDNRTILTKVLKTWKSEDGRTKIHYSQQATNKRIGAHTETINAEQFLKFYLPLEDLSFDIMLEVKDKNRSAIKINLLFDNDIKVAEKEWSRYKYLVLGKSASNYLKIREILKNKNQFKADEFYRIIDDSLLMKENVPSEVNALQHVYGYFKKMASKKEKEVFLSNLMKYQESKITLNKVKKQLRTLALKYEINYLINSYYFSSSEE